MASPCNWVGLIFVAIPLVICSFTSASEPSDTAWSQEDTRSVLEKTLTVILDPDLSELAPEELKAVGLLLEAGAILHELYEEQKHMEAAAALAALSQGESISKGDTELATLHRLFSGPIGTTLDNRRLAFLPVAPEVPGRNVYPPAIERDEIASFLDEHADSRGDLLHLRSVVRRATSENLEVDLGKLDRFQVLDTLHPGLRENLHELQKSPDPKMLYALPYSVRWAESTMELYRLLHKTAEVLAKVDSDFATYLRNRARDLLSDDYEGGDSSWVTGRFGNLNAQIGSYETYDDKLYGVKSFYSLSLLVRDKEKSEKLAAAISDLQILEDNLPYDRHKRVRKDIPVGVYRVIADFGQARGTNTATILPNEADHARKYGRTILLRYNVMTHPDLFSEAEASFRTVLAPEHTDDLSLEGGFERTLWHEVGHYLGVDRTADGRLLGEALERNADLFEELKSDLVSLYSAKALRDSGYHSDRALRSIYAGGILRVLQLVEPRREQPYQTMQLMQWNYFLDKGLLTFDPEGGRLSIAYDRYHDVVGSLLREVLAIQSAGDRDRATAFIERWGAWREDLHEVVAARLRDKVQYRYRLVRYAAVD